MPPHSKADPPGYLPILIVAYGTRAKANQDFDCCFLAPRLLGHCTDTNQCNHTNANPILNVDYCAMAFIDIVPKLSHYLAAATLLL
jgi:hypothetical protein